MKLSLRELDALACALLAVLLAFLATRVARHHALGLQLAAQLRVELRKTLKAGGMVTRDARGKERKKYGQKGARARFQFSKR